MNPLSDEHLANFVVKSHIRSHPDYQKEVEAEVETTTKEVSSPRRQLTWQYIPQELLRKYIMYAKMRVHPKIPTLDMEKIKNLYAELRKESKVH